MKSLAIKRRKHVNVSPSVFFGGFKILQLVGCIDLDHLPLSGLALNQWENSTVSLKKTNKNQQKLKTPMEKGAAKKIESLLLDVLKSILESISIKELETNEESFIEKYSADDAVLVKSD
ncbi:hypothetical protein ACFE04_009310 [Oxalis oulophora]